VSANFEYKQDNSKSRKPRTAASRNAPVLA
jgi:hypothetical protein